MANPRKTDTPDPVVIAEEQLATVRAAVEKAEAARTAAVAAQLEGAAAQERAESAIAAARQEAEALERKLVVLGEAGERGSLTRDLAAVQSLADAAKAKTVQLVADLTVNVSVLVSAARVGHGIRQRLQNLTDEHVSFYAPTPGGLGDGDPHGWAALLEEARGIGARRGLMDPRPFETTLKVPVHRLDLLERGDS